MRDRDTRSWDESLASANEAEGRIGRNYWKGSSRKEVLLARVTDDPKDRKAIYERIEEGRIPDPGIRSLPIEIE